VWLGSARITSIAIYLPLTVYAGVHGRITPALTHFGSFARLEAPLVIGADLAGSNLTSADLTGANLTNANLAGATMPDGTINP